MISRCRVTLFVALEADVPGRFDQNAFTLLPGQNAKIKFTRKMLMQNQNSSCATNIPPLSEPDEIPDKTVEETYK